VPHDLPFKAAWERLATLNLNSGSPGRLFDPRSAEGRQSGMDGLYPAARVVISGIESRPELNGCNGKLLTLDEEKGRWGVQLVHASVTWPEYRRAVATWDRLERWCDTQASPSPETCNPLSCC
jgi:hypothetical protein